jgi:4-alpha-glucanotransferase
MSDTSIRPTLPNERRAGVCLHITSLAGPYGIGELGKSAHDFVDDLERMQLSVWQFLPLGPTAYGDSPYQPLSTFAGNEMLIDIGDLVAQGLLTRDEVAELTTLPRHYVDYGALKPIKDRLLKLAARRFEGVASDTTRIAFNAFLKRNNRAWLHDYALYRILKSRHGEKPWPQWLPEYVHRDKTALRAIEAAEAEQIKAIKVMQFLFFQQWRQLRDYAHARGVLLFGDMPIYIALDSSDAWANRKLVKIDEDGNPDSVAGVPPDYFSEDGQLWGNPLYDWKHHKATKYRWWVKRLKATAELADLVRIDHFRGFESYWSIPAGSATARNGTWEPGPGDAIFDAMRKSIGSLPIIAEDLGVITPAVEGLRDRQQFPGMRVLQFEVCNDDFKPEDIGINSVCYTGTHDNDTTLGWFRGSPGDLRSEEEIKRAQNTILAVTGGSAETVHMDLIRIAFSTAACIAIAPMQDFLGLGSEARINTPGVAGDNWRWRVLDGQVTDDLCESIATMVGASDR